MKKLSPLTLITAAIFLISCNSAANIDKADICGKEFIETVHDPMSHEVTITSTTVFNSDGTFTSEQRNNLDDPSEVHQAQFNGNYQKFTGKWHLVKDIPDNVKQAVKAYGVTDNNYSIIKYSSSNGVSGYCMYNLVNSKGAISALNTGQVSQYDWANVPGAAGIYDGFLNN